MLHYTKHFYVTADEIFFILFFVVFSFVLLLKYERFVFFFLAKHSFVVLFLPHPHESFWEKGVLFEGGGGTKERKVSTARRKRAEV